MALTKAGEDFTFPIEYDPFLGRELGEDEDDGLSDEHKKLAEIKYGENDDTRDKMLGALKARVKEERYKVPLRKPFLLKILRAGQILSFFKLNSLCIDIF